MLPLDPPLTPGAARVWFHPDRPLSQAEAEAFAAAPSSTKAQRRIARHILERDPENIWAMALLAAHAPTHVERIALLREAVRVGLRLWAGELRRGRPSAALTGSDAGKVFLNAVAAYGAALADGGCAGDASRCLDFLLRIDPDDSIDARRTIGSRVDRAEASSAAERLSGSFMTMRR